MIKQHKDLAFVSDELILWKYMPLDKFLFLIREKKLHFHRIDSFEDKSEGTLSLIDKDLFSYSEEVKDIWKRDRKRHFVNCWIAMQYESSLMWNVYAKNGVAIRTTVHNLKESMSEDKERICYISRVKYIDNANGSSQDGGTPLNFLKIFFTKRMYYQQESELRILYPIYDFPVDESKKGEELPVNVNSLMREIVISPYADKLICNLTQDIVLENKMKAQVRLSNIKI